MSRADLKRIFNYNAFRPGQEKIIQTIQSGQDVLVLMPTGAGKSLCFQLPAIVAKGVTIVISPLISLIYDQVTALQNLGICAYYLNSTTPPLQRLDALNDLENTGTEDEPTCECKLLYTTPESLTSNDEMTDRIDQLYENGLLEGFVIDEAHCVSNWGHDFRNSYLDLKVIKEYYPLIPIWCFTATATPKAQLDIVKQLNLKDYRIFINSYIRKNLSYQIEEKPSHPPSHISRLIKKKYIGQSGIVYCLSRKNCESMAKFLLGKGISCGFYHAGLSDHKKKAIQDKWLEGKIKVIVATIAFALGINKSDVRFVIHESMPKSIESYYQQTGRAGRDGKNSDCIMFYNYRDKVVLESFSDKNTSKGAPTKANTRVRLTYAMCQNRYDCLKQQLSNYLGEYIEYKCEPGENQCRNCFSPTSGNLKDFSQLSKKIITHVSKNKDISVPILLSYFDKQTKYCVGDLNRLFMLLLCKGYLQVKPLVGDKNITDGVQVGDLKLTDQKILMKFHLQLNTVDCIITPKKPGHLNFTRDREQIIDMLNNFKD